MFVCNLKQLDFRWNDALSMTITASFGRHGKRYCSNQYSNSVLSIVPSYCIGATNVFPSFSATILVRLNLRPGIFPKTSFPLGAYPYIRCKYASILVSSTHTIFSSLHSHFQVRTCTNRDCTRAKSMVK